MTTVPMAGRGSLTRILALIVSPAIVIFLSSNFVNLGNLAFNMIFSRLMGPALFGDLAIVLTIKLALLGVFGALSSAVSHKIAAQGAATQAQTVWALARINKISFVALWLASPLIIAALVTGSVAERLDVSSPYVLLILVASLPFVAPLNILRGIALGRMDSKKIVVSANIEMAVRLGFGVLAWQAGFGIEGVVAAIGLSIVAGWAVLLDVLPAPKAPVVPIRPLAISLGIAVLPFGLLQIAQVAALDGDIFLATHFLSDAETGYVAALSLFQRIQFFACFALAGVLLPSVVIAMRNGQSYLQSVLAISGLLITVSAIVLTLSLAYPAQLLRLLVGPEYVAAAPYLWQVAAAAVLFTVNYLVAAFLLARGNAFGVAIVVIGSAAQIGLMIVTLSSDVGTISTMFATKLGCQAGILTFLLTQLRTSAKTQSL